MMRTSRARIRISVSAFAALILIAGACTRDVSDEANESVATNESVVATTPASESSTSGTTTDDTATTVIALPTTTPPEPVPAAENPGPSATAVDDAGIGDLAAGNHRFLLEHDGRDRSYRVYVPAAHEASPAVLIALHGGGGTGEQFQAENEMDAVADSEGFIVLYPEGTGVLPNRLHTWNSGFNCCGYSLDRNVDDVGFLRAVIDDFATRADTDRGRVYMTGHSNGAMMSYRFAAEAADMITAIAPVAGALSVADPSPSQPVPLLHIHSVDDPRALYEGGEGSPFPGTERTHVVEPTFPGIETWAALSGCDAGPTIADSIDGSGDERLDRLAWSCPAGIAVEHLRLTVSGHGWPGIEVGPVWQRLLGPPTTIINASEEVWAFVSRFDRTP